MEPEYVYADESLEDIRIEPGKGSMEALVEIPDGKPHATDVARGCRPTPNESLSEAPPKVPAAATKAYNSDQLPTEARQSGISQHDAQGSSTDMQQSATTDDAELDMLLSGVCLI